jgi:hypothetical protein
MGIRAKAKTENPTAGANAVTGTAPATGINGENKPDNPKKQWQLEADVYLPLILLLAKLKICE